MSTRRQILDTLRQRVQDLQSGLRPGGRAATTGCPDFDAFLGGGIERGSIVEWIGLPGAGATTLAIAVARAVCQEQGLLMVVDQQRMFYPPAAQALGLNLDQTIVVQPASRKDFQWSLIQTLRCPGISAVVCWPQRASERMLRRLQIAAERGGTLGLLVRPPSVVPEPTWAHYRLMVEALHTPAGSSRRWQVTLIRGPTQQQGEIQLEMDHETGRLQKACPLPVATSLVSPACLQGAS